MHVLNEGLCSVFEFTNSASSRKWSCPTASCPMPGLLPGSMEYSQWILDEWMNEWMNEWIALGPDVG